MPLFKRTLSEFVFRRFVLIHHSSNLLVDLNLEAKKDTLKYIKANMVDAPYFEKHPQLIAFLHVDWDLYSSSATIFDLLGRRLQTGAIILFDEYYNFHRWQQHEFKAFQEFAQKSGLKYEYIAFSVTGQQVAVRVLKNPACKA